MKKYAVGVVIVLSAFILGGFAAQYFWPTAIVPMNGMGTTGEKKPIYWVAPMDPSYRRDKPGKSPMGMDLVPVYEQKSSGNQPGFIVSPEVEQNLGVRTSVVSRQNISRKIETVGYVKVDENRIEHLHTYTDGWVRRLLVKTTGEHVVEGQLILEFYSPSLVNAQEEYLLSLSSQNKSLLDASHKKLLTLGVSEQQIKELKDNKRVMQLVKIFSGQSGTVSALNIREGMYVKPNVNIMTIEDLTHIWIIGEIFERQSQWVKEGQPAEANLSYLPGQKWIGKVDYVYPRLDPTTHTLKVRLLFDNKNEALKPNMYADVTILGTSEKDVLVIPREAVIYTGKGARVIVSLGDGRYVAKGVKLGIESGDEIVVLSGLEAGEIIVTSGQFLMDSESSLKASFDRMKPGEKSQSVNQ